MKDKLELILVGAILENSNKDNKNIIIDNFKYLEDILEKGVDIFERIPKNIYKELERLPEGNLKTGLDYDIETNWGEDNYKEIEYFEEPGVLIYDGIHRSAFGRMSYYYRSKGIRIYYLSSKEILIVSPYSYVDSMAFQFNQEEAYRFKISTLSMEDLEIIFRFIAFEDEEYEKLNFHEELIKILVSIKKTFNRMYYLEFILPPPDVNRLSIFSENVKNILWENCLGLNFENDWGTEVQESTMRFLIALGISPPPNHLVNFIKTFSNQHNYNDLNDKLNFLFETLTKPEDIVEIKPNFNGIGINFNAAYKILRKKMYGY